MEDKKISITDFDKSLLIYLDIDSIVNNESIKKTITNEFVECLIRYKNFSASMFGCYEFLDEPTKGILYDEKCKCVFTKILIHIKDNNFDTLNKLIERIKQEINDSEKLSNEEYILTFVLIFNLYLKENVWGPSSIFVKETEKIDFEDDLYKVNDNYFNTLSKNESLLKEDEIYKEINNFGEDIYKHSNYIILFYIAFYFLYNPKKDKEIIPLNIINTYTDKNYFSLNIWKIRLLKIWNKLIIEPIDEISKEIEILYEKLKIIDIDNITLGSLLIEKSFNYMRYYKYKKCTTTIEEAKQKLNLDISLTGKIGKKTKYQTFSNAILVVDVKNPENNSENTKQNEKISENNISLDSVRTDNPLLEKPTLIDPEEEKLFSNQIITIKDQIYLCALLNYLHKGLPDEEINREIILSYSEKGLKNSIDWLVYSKLLLHRSLAESKSTKKIERSLLQIESLCNQYNDRNPNPYERMKYSFIIDYPMIFTLKKLYAESFMNYGALKTAYSIFKELFLYEDAIKCLYASNDKIEAQKLAKSVLEKKPEPGIYCILGELDNNPDLFYKALEITGNKFPRAYRCLGRYYHVNKNIEKAKEFYEKAMSINPSFPDIWFKLGMIYLSEQNFKKGLVAFSKILNNDDSNGEVWGNLGVCFIKLNKFKEASKCFQEGYMKTKNNWHMLDNLIYASIENKDISKIIYAIGEFYNISQHDKIKNSYFFVVTQFFIENINNYSEHDKEYLSKKIYEIFMKYSEVDGLRPEIWDLYANFFNEVEINQKKNLSNDEYNNLYKCIIEIRMKEIRTITVKNINWVKDSKIKEIVLKIIGIIRQILDKIKDDKDKNYLNDKLFYLDGMENRIKNYEENQNK